MSKDDENRVLDDVLGFRLRKAHNKLNQHWARTAAERNIEETPVEAGILMTIGSNAGISHKRLASLLGIEASTLTQALVRLLKRNLVLRGASSADRRRLQLTLSEEGEKACLKVTKLVEHRQTSIPGGLTEEERVQLNGLLGKIIDPQ